MNVTTSLSLPAQASQQQSQSLQSPQTPRAPGQSYTVPDPNNSIAHPTGSQYQLSLSEGIYALRDEITLGIVPPHPTENLGLPHHVLDPRIGPPSAGVQLALAVMAPRKTPPRLRRVPTKNSLGSSIPPSIQEHAQESSASGSDAGSANVLTNFATGNFKNLFGGGGSAAPSDVHGKDAKDSKDSLKRKKPKTNITKTGSSFVSRWIPHDVLNKRLQERSNDGLMAFLNHSRTFHWLDLAAPNKHEPLAKILFTRANAMCHDCNSETSSTSHIDLAIGFNTSDIIWLEPMSQKYTRINKNGAIHSSPVTAIKWVPGSENLFLTGHMDGTVMLLDKERDDIAFTPDTVSLDSATPSSGDSPRQPRIVVKKSMASKSQKNNPVALWKVSKLRINEISFSPDGKFVALASEDSTLKLIDFFEERLVKLFPAYFGGVNCVAWSPDGLYMVSGGQDDTLQIWSTEEREVVARCMGHKSFVTHVAFDPWRCDERTYRIGSVGDDCQLLLWDFSVTTLPRPRAPSARHSITSMATPVLGSRTHSSTSLSHLPAANGNAANSTTTSSKPMLSPATSRDPDHLALPDDAPLRYPTVPRNQRPVMPPVLTKKIDVHELSWVGFEEDCILTACKKGHIHTWDRPKVEDAPSRAGSVGLPGFSDPFKN